MPRLNIENCVVWGTIACLVAAFWASAVVFGVPFARHLIEAAAQRPAACAGLNGWDCTARAQEGW